VSHLGETPELAPRGHPAEGVYRARDPACPPGVLVKLAGNPDRRVRQAVARNPASPPGVRAALGINRYT